MVHVTFPDLPESRWTAAIALLAIASVRFALPESLEVGPRWLHVVVLVVLLLATIFTHRSHRESLNQKLAYTLATIILLFVVWSLILLILAIPGNKQPPAVMLRSSVALWISNVLVFAYWYWRIDGGGPHYRARKSAVHHRAFLFPQMALKDQDNELIGAWSPRFVDYAFIAFNTSMAFSPTDTPILTRGAKVLSMMQSAISLTIVVVLAAHAIGMI